MILLGVESTAKTASVCLFRDGAVVAERICTEQRRHSDTLMPMADEMLSAAGLTLKDVDLFAVDIGPGSFTGVRIGTASVNALAHALRKQVVGVDSLTVIHMAAGCPPNALILLDAGGGRAYAAQFTEGTCTMEPRMGTRAEFLENKPANVLLLENAEPHAAALCAAAARRINDAKNAVFPLYLAPSQAERMFAARQGAKKV